MAITGGANFIRAVSSPFKKGIVIKTVSVNPKTKTKPDKIIIDQWRWRLKKTCLTLFKGMRSSSQDSLAKCFSRVT
jgi:hypothetical protein